MGSKVTDILVLVSGLLAKYSITHVGCNDIPNQRSEILQHDLARLLDFCKVSWKQIFILIQSLLLREALLVLAGPLACTPGSNKLFMLFLLIMLILTKE